MELINRIKGKVGFWRRTVVLYGTNQMVEADPMPYEFLILSNFSDLQKIDFDFDAAEYTARFSNYNLLCCLKEGGRVVAYGWINPGPIHNLGELALEMHVRKKAEVFYDFLTLPTFRGRGLYPVLLRQMIARNDVPKIIYVLQENEASVRGIEKAGFKRLGLINGLNKKKYFKMLSQLWQK